MHVSELPHGTAPAPVPLPHFPTLWQAVLWRNWGLIPSDRLARVLRISSEALDQAATELSLPVPTAAPAYWAERGYTTIIRKNWHLLPYEQLLELLGWDAARMAFTLKEDDFLWHKLGGLKPATPPVYFAPLTAAQRRQTAKLRKILARYFSDAATAAVPGFDFIRKYQSLDTCGLCADTQSSSTANSIGNAGAGRPRPTNADRPVSEFMLDNTWRLVMPDTADRHLRAFAGRWLDRLAARWNVRLAPADVAAADKSIILEIQPDAVRPPESHTIVTQDGNIRVTGVDVAGVMRALTWMEERMAQAGAPCLPPGTVERRTRFNLRCVYPYYLLYGDPLADPAFQPAPAGLFERYARLGINGIWLQGVLYGLTAWPGMPDSESVKRALRLAALRRLVDEAAGYGIGVYLYLNEPRCMPLKYFEQFPAWRGVLHGNGMWAGYCTSQPAVRDVLRAATTAVFRDVPGLAGAFLITMSENLTNCWSKAAPGSPSQCPRCRERGAAVVVGEVNRTIAQGVFAANPNARVIAWTWGWARAFDVAQAVNHLAPGTTLMCTSEEAMPLEKGGVKVTVADYTMSNPGPGDRARGQWAVARAQGLPAAAKVQLNTTWECPAIPWLPVCELVREHMENLTREPVDALVLSWTLGGYPSFNLKLAARYYWNETGLPSKRDRLAGLLEDEFGATAAPLVRRALCHFSAAFREFPFELRVLYVGPQNPGPANLLFEKATGYAPTMVGFPYDALASWCGSYPVPVFEEQFRKLSTGWRKGLPLLVRAAACATAQGQSELAELERMAWGAWTHFRSVYLQVVFVRLRDQWAALPDADRPAMRRTIRRILHEEIDLARRLCELVARDSTIGFEATNQYAYTIQDLKEKTLNCDWLRARFRA